MRGALLVLLCLLASTAHAQETLVVRDLEAWTGAGIRRDVGDARTVSVEQSFRTWHNSSQLDQVRSEVGVSVSALGSLRFGLGYTYILDRDRTVGSDGKVWDHAHRWNLDGEFRSKVERLTLGYRMRYQRISHLGLAEDASKDAEWTWRNRVSARYNLKGSSHSPFLETEIFRLLGNIAPGHFSKARFTMGTRHKLNKVTRLKLFYRIERDLNEAYPATTHIAGFNYTFDWR